MAWKEVWGSAKSGIRSRLGARCFYYSEQLEPLFEVDTKITSGVGRLALVVLSRRHYFETVQDFPINDPLELRRALALMPKEGPFKGTTLYQAHRLPAGGQRVIFWTLRERLPLPRADGSLRLLIPESALLRRLDMSGIRRFDDHEGTLFIRSRDGEIKSFFAPLGQIALLARTAQGFGESSEALEGLSGQPLRPALRQAIKRLTAADILAFLNYEGRPLQPFPWKGAGAILGAGLATYLCSVSFFLWAQGIYLERALEQRAPEIAAALALDQETRALGRELVALQEEIEQAAPTWAAWPVLLDLLDNGMKLRNLRLEGSEVTIFGVGDSATQLLEKVVTHANAQDATFTQPVRQQRDGEHFAITFTPRANGAAQ